MKRAGVIGWPVTHSLSPVLHGYWLKQHGIEGSYEKIPAEPKDFAATIKGLRDEGFAGVNVTVPHKQAAFALADSNDEVAKSAAAANLLVFGEAGISGRNTDAYGLKASLQENIGSLGGASAVLLGAGGAARGALLSLDGLGAGAIHLLARDVAKAQGLAGAVRLKAKVFAGTLAEWQVRAPDAALVVNSTSAGMDSNPPLDLELSALPADAAVCDMVYSPLETQLLKEAKARGLKTIDGLGMLMHQAVPSFEAFFGVRPEVTPGLRAALVAELESRG